MIIVIFNAMAIVPFGLFSFDLFHYLYFIIIIIIIIIMLFLLLLLLYYYYYCYGLLFSFIGHM